MQAASETRDETLTVGSPEWEAVISGHCHTAELSPIQTEIVLLCAEGWSDLQIAGKLRLPLRQTRMDRECAIARLRAVIVDFEYAAREFPLLLARCVANKAFHDERPRDVRGVTPDRSSQRFQGAVIVPGDDLRLRQDPVSTLRLWARAIEPVFASP